MAVKDLLIEGSLPKKQEIYDIVDTISDIKHKFIILSIFELLSMDDIPALNNLKVKQINPLGNHITMDDKVLFVKSQKLRNICLEIKKQFGDDEYVVGDKVPLTNNRSFYEKVNRILSKNGCNYVFIDILTMGICYNVVEQNLESYTQRSVRSYLKALNVGGRGETIHKILKTNKLI